MNAIRSCSVIGCKGKYLAKGFCVAHYNRQLLGISFDKPIRPFRPVNTPEEWKERLLRYRKIAENGCWEFTGALCSSGYGNIKINGVVYAAHRLAAMLWLGLDGNDPRAYALHKKTCPSRKCFNPDHLYIGDHAQNIKDRDEMGRCPRGMGHPKVKLSEQDVRDIRADKISTGMALAKKYGISYSTLYQARNGMTWKWLPD